VTSVDYGFTMPAAVYHTICTNACNNQLRYGSAQHVACHPLLPLFFETRHQSRLAIHLLRWTVIPVYHFVPVLLTDKLRVSPNTTVDWPQDDFCECKQSPRENHPDGRIAAQ